MPMLLPHLMTPEFSLLTSFTPPCSSEVFDSHQFGRWVEEARAPAIEPSLKLYNALLELGFKIILLTGRSEAHRSVTVDNLRRAGFQSWDKLILRSRTCNSS